MIYYPIPQDKLPIYKGQYPESPRSNQFSDQVISLPIWPTLDRETQDYVVSCIKAFFNA
jgi:dTDP-4-amino-4,6-dideoxygalactose transaminase